MSVTIQQVLAQLNPDEPNYQQAAGLGPEAVPHLKSLVLGGDSGLASKAAYLAGFIASDQSTSVVELAARSPDPIVRVAAAASLRNLRTVPLSSAFLLIDDVDPGVRRLTLESLQVQRPIAFKSKIQEMA